ncbi:unnamed protein product [Agarophyton chilense]|eukprot:gb/GEZJ01000606.1/.p1 GENE.gb/GEZJ01000606.1/~~gb/GEZJ01000606.1/.p1  ORF type:complete len:1053 (+),score=156.96 gb/GEZJ01000606.1/:127-3285(+)
MDRIAFVSAWHGAALAASRWRMPIARRHSKLFSNPLIYAPSRRISTASVAATAQDSGKKQIRKRNHEVSPYSATVNLPQTTFEQRANATKKEPQIQQFWSDKSVYERLSRENPGDTFVLHDGPPFANGPLHCGHALNKILKDIINKYQLMKGRKAVFVPGWDTHGLPIELKVLQSLKGSERKNLTPVDLRKKARAFALETIKNHIQGMKRFGVWGDWDDPYLTLSPDYEAAQMEVFGIMYEKGYVFRGKKPVHWSPSSRTALAEAELEYPEGHTSRSCYCAFRVTKIPERSPKSIAEAISSESGLALSIWTTTPWTIPANRAVAVNTRLDYALVKGLHPKQPELVVVAARDLVDSIALKLNQNEKVKVLSVVKGDELLGVEYNHPLEENKICRVVEGGDYITTDTGTGLVHTAPGHGQEDYQTGLREGLDILSPVNDAGKFTEEAANGRFTDLPVLGEGNQAVLDALDESDVLILEESYSHKYPYDWRTKKPTIFRATEQWFISIDGFREDVLNAIEEVEWFPAGGIKRIRGMVEGRGDWCISRQRAWGVPIPVFYDDTTGTALMSREIVNYVKDIIHERGTDAWWELEADDLLPEKYRGRNLRKGRDTMDVWFDSGSSWAAVASQRDTLSYPVDLYLEGSDQHRGWFQSSILTSVATMERAPYRKVLTHGFVLDEKGIKMSKSVGNVVDPMKVISGGNNKKKEPPYGSDVLRLWVSSVDYSSDIMIGPSILKQVADVYKKLRNTLRYMLGNIHDFNPVEHEVPYDSLPSLDRYILTRMMSLADEVEAAYDSFSFFKVYQALQRFAVVDLSNFYLDIAKDRLYVSSPDSFRRRSCQTVIASVLENYARALAPIVSHTAEDLWQNMPYTPRSANSSFPEASSVYEAGWFERRSEWMTTDREVTDDWNVVLEARDAVNKVLEAARTSKTLGASMEASVKIFAADPGDAIILQKMVACPDDVDSLKRAFIVSNVEVTTTADVVRECTHVNADGNEEELRFVVGIDKAVASKCDRCWHYDHTVGTHLEHPLLCSRCNEAVLEMGISTVPAVQSEAV